MRKIIPIIGINAVLVLAIAGLLLTHFRAKPIIPGISLPAVLSAENVSLPPSASPSANLMISPKSVTLAFYQAYVECMKDPPAEVSTKARNYCQAYNPYATNDFFQNIKNEAFSNIGFDNVICTQSAPKEIQVGETNAPQNGQVTVAVTNILKEGKQINIKAVTSQSDGQWKVSNILCAK